MDPITFLIYSQRDRGIYTEYRQTAAMAAIRDFIGLMPDGVNDYVNELRTFITAIYMLRRLMGKQNTL